MKRLVSSSLALLALLTVTAPALAQHDRDGDYHHWQHGHARHRQWHGRDVTYWNGHWGYWQPRGGAHIFINVPL
jgi:hypothetical protein